MHTNNQKKQDKKNEQRYNKFVKEMNQGLIQCEEQANIKAQRMANIPMEVLEQSRVKEQLLPIKNLHQELVNNTDQFANAENRHAEAENAKKNEDEEIKRIQEKINAKQADINYLKGSANRGAEYLRPEMTTWFYFFLAVVGLSFGEGIFNFKAYSLFGVNTITSLALAGLVGGILYLLSDILPTITRKFFPNSRRGQIALLLFVILIIGIAFYYLGEMRSDWINQLNRNKKYGYKASPWVYCALNTIVFIISTAIVYLKKPSKEKILQWKNYKNALKNIACAEKELEVLKKEQAEIPQRYRLIYQANYNTCVIAGQWERKVQSAYEKNCGLLKSELLLATNGQAAKLFTNGLNDFPKLKLRYQDYTKENKQSKSWFNLSVLGFGLLLITSCSQPSSTNYIRILKDDTDPQEVVQRIHITPEQVKTHILPNENNGAIVEVTSITHARHATPIKKVQIAPVGNTWLSMEVERMNEVDSFLTASSALINDMAVQSTGQNRSLVFYHISESINALLRSPADRLELVVLSDLAELSKYFNTYSEYGMNLLEHHPDSLHAILDQFPIKNPNKRRLRISLIYQSTTEQNDLRFHYMSKIIQDYYQDKFGFEVNIYHSFNNYLNN